MIPTSSLIRMFIAIRASRILGTPRRAASTKASAETIAEAVSPKPGTSPMSGSRPKRNFVPGKRRNSSMISASHLKNGSSEARRSFSSGDRILHPTSRVFIRFDGRDDQGPAKEQIERIHRPHRGNVLSSQRPVLLRIAAVNDEIACVDQHIEEREDNKRTSLIFVDRDPKMAKAGALQRVREIKPIDRRNVAAGEVHVSLVRSDGPEKIVEAR